MADIGIGDGRGLRVELKGWLRIVGTIVGEGLGRLLTTSGSPAAENGGYR